MAPDDVTRPAAFTPADKDNDGPSPFEVNFSRSSYCAGQELPLGRSFIRFANCENGCLRAVPLYPIPAVLLTTSSSCGFADFFESNHQLGSRVQEIYQPGSEGGARLVLRPYPYQAVVTPVLMQARTRYRGALSCLSRLPFRATPAHALPR